MIKPIDPSTDHLDFRCDECGAFVNQARLYHDAPTQNDKQEYDVRNWIIAGIELRCPGCGSEMRYKLALRRDSKKRPAIAR